MNADSVDEKIPIAYASLSYGMVNIRHSEIYDLLAKNDIEAGKQQCLNLKITFSKRSCHARESGHLYRLNIKKMDSRVRGNDKFRHYPANAIHIDEKSRNSICFGIYSNDRRRFNLLDY